jgi:hypothetical protein
VRIDPSYSHHAYSGDQTLHAKATEKIAHERAVERADRERITDARASERLTFGEFLERENLRTVRDIEFQTETVGVASERPSGDQRGKYGSPSIGDVFQSTDEAHSAKPESLCYDKDGKPYTPATSGFVAVMVDVIA